MKSFNFITANSANQFATVANVVSVSNVLKGGT